MELTKQQAINKIVAYFNKYGWDKRLIMMYSDGVEIGRAHV